MNCQQALALISAEIDHEIQAGDQVRLRDHLEQCEACRAQADALYLQDAELRRSFTARRRAAAATAERVVARLAVVAPTGKDRRERRAPGVSRYFRWTLAAAVLLGIGFGLYRLAPRFGAVPNLAAGGEDLGSLISELDYLTPRRLPPEDLRPPLAVGEQRQTGANERQRVALPDGSVVYLNQNTNVRLDADRRLNVESGEVFVEVAPAPGDSRPPLARSTFVVRTAQREVTALGTKFAVKVEPAGTSVVVTQGKVEVSGVSGVLSAGQQLRADGDRPDFAPRASVVLDWLREPIAAAESPLVPRSQHSGGSLIAVDPWGQEAKLSLRNYHVDVHIEDGFARTTVDQTYFNHNAWRMEGTFYFPLPPDASLSRLAMYVADGKECNLMEGGMAERDYARNVFEQIVTRQKDPALLEWLDGSTFKMRVFPLEGRQEKRIILSYVQRLDSLYGRLGYRFPGGHNLPLVNRWSANIRVKNGADLAWSCAGYPLDKQTDGKDLVLTTSARDVKPDRDLALELVEKGVGSLFGGVVQGDAAKETVAEKTPDPFFASSVHEGARYLMVRYRPNLTSPRQVQRRDWVFLFESSGDRDPLLARAQIEIIRTLLSNAGHEDTFAIVQAGTRCRVLEAKQVTPENVKAGLEFLDKAHLIGALDLGTALREAAKLATGAPNPTIVHVGSGIAALGLRNENDLSRRVPDHVPYVGVGVGKRWARSFMKATAERTGGAFTQINPDESIGWRSFELFSLLNTPRLMNVKVIDDMERMKFLTFNSMVAQGEEVCAIARIAGRAGDVSPPVPTSVTIDGTFEGKPFRVTLPVADVQDKADYLPRAWAKLEIDRLVAEDKDKNKEQIVDLSKKMYVMSPFTSLLVLENEQMYEQFKVDRGRKDHWALYPCPAKIPNVYEPDPSQGIDVRNAPRGVEPPSQKPTIEQVLNTIVVRTRPVNELQATIENREAEVKNLDGRLKSLRRIQAYGNLMDQGRYEEAYREVFTPLRPVMVATYDMTLTATRIRETDTAELLRAAMSHAIIGIDDKRDLDNLKGLKRTHHSFTTFSFDLASPGGFPGQWGAYSLYVPGLRGPHQGQSIVVNLDRERLRAYNLSPQDVASALNLGQMIAPTGNARIKDMMPIVSVNSLVVDPKEAGMIPIRSELGLYLRDVLHSKTGKLKDLGNRNLNLNPTSIQGFPTSNDNLVRYRSTGIWTGEPIVRSIDLGRPTIGFQPPSFLPPGNPRYSNPPQYPKIDPKDLGGIPIRPESGLYLRDLMLKRKIEFEIAFDSARERNANLMAQYQQLLNQFEAARLGKARDDLETKLKKLEDKIPQVDLLAYDQARARIVAVDKAQQTCYLNLGAADFVKPGLTFSVFGEGEYKPSAERKACVEIVKITGDHLSLARVTDSKNAKPIVAGDQLYNPSWFPGLRDHVAIAGLIDLNGDGQDGTAELVKALEQQGIIVDAWLDLKDQSLKGALQAVGPKTSYLILGDEPETEHELTDPRRAKKTTTLQTIDKLVEDATAKGIYVVGARRYLALAGMKVPGPTARQREFQRLAGLARNPPPEDIRGRVKAVADKDGLVTINLGSDSGLARDQTLEVYRLKPRPQYLGLVRIVDVRPSEAIGKLIAPRRTDVRVGDEVASSILDRDMIRSLKPPPPGPLNAAERIFCDLLSHAPGMNTSRADILATLEAEARRDPATAPGMIDPGAARLIAQARAAGWQSIRLPADWDPAFTVVFDGRGRFTYDRVRADGLRERVFCDGTTLWHLYPDLHIAAKRAYSRFHRSELTALVPWALPPAEDLARGCNLTLHDADTVRIVPRGLDDKTAPAVLDLVFADGRLTERRLVHMPSRKVVWRETYSAAGVVNLFDAEGMWVRETDLAIQPAEAEPPLTPRTTSYVVLPLPHRTLDHVRQKHDADKKVGPAPDGKLVDDAQLEMFAAWLHADFWQPLKDPWPADNDDRRLGVAVLMLAAGRSEGHALLASLAGNEPLLRYLQVAGDPNGLAMLLLAAERMEGHGLLAGNEPLPRYLKVVSDPNARLVTPVGQLAGPADGFVQRLAAFRDLYAYWSASNGTSSVPQQQKLAETLAFIRAHAASPRGWALLNLLRERVGDEPGARRELAALYPLFGEISGIGYTARYEHAALLAEDGQTDKARAAYLELYRKTLDSGLLPPIDGRFRETVQQGDANTWPELVRQAARSLAARNQRNAVIALAGQCRMLDDARLADEVVGLALDGVPAADKGPIALAAVAYHLENDQPAQAEAIVNDLLKDDRLAQDAGLWFLAAALAGREQPNQRSVFCFDKALTLEFRQLPEVINVQHVRQQYGQLLAAYDNLVTARAFVEESRRALIDRVVSAADRWRSLDTDPTAACQAAAQILKKLGATDLAWEYLTTPTALQPHESQPWLQLGQALAAERAYDLADRAFVAAFEAESTNPEILMQRAGVLRSAGKHAEARRLYRQIANGTWQPRFADVQQQARWDLGMR
jgi:hypothetical protein